MNYVGSHARTIATYHGPPWPQPGAEVPVTDTEVAAWRVKWSATCSEKLAALLCALERDFAIGAEAGRSAGPTA